MDRIMNAMRIQSFGGPEVLHLDKIAIPKPGEAEVLLKTRAASVNPVDYKIRKGDYPAVKADQLPIVLGREPGAEVLDGSSIFLDEVRGMPARVEVIDVVWEPLAKKIGPDAVADAGTTEDVVEHGCPPFGLQDRRRASRIIWTDSKDHRAARMRLEVIAEGAGGQSHQDDPLHGGQPRGARGHRARRLRRRSGRGNWR